MSEPTETPVLGDTDPEGDVSTAHIDLLAAEAYIDGDRLLVIFHFAGLPEELEEDALSSLDGFLWRAHVFPDGPVSGPPPYVVDVEPQLGTFSASGSGVSYRAVVSQRTPNPEQPPSDTWPAAMELDTDARVVRVAARIPGLGQGTQVQLVAYRFDAPNQPPVEDDGSAVFGITQRSFALGADLAAPPQAIELEPMPDGGAAYDLRPRGIPVRIVAPPGWSLQLPPAGVFFGGVSPPEAGSSGTPGIGVSLRDLTDMPELDSAAAVLERIVSETGGAYEVVTDAPPFDLPPGFEATALLRTVRPSQWGAEPGRVLNNWTAVEGSTIRLIIGMVGGQALVGYLEAIDWPRAEEFLPYLAQMEIIAD